MPRYTVTIAKSAPDAIDPAFSKGQLTFPLGKHGSVTVYPDGPPIEEIPAHDYIAGYYVTMRDGNRTAWLVGPFSTEAEARDILPQAMNKAIELDRYNHFHTFGTASITLPRGRVFPSGKLNRFFDKLA